MKGNKYQVSMGGKEIFSDGKTSGIMIKVQMK